MPLSTNAMRKDVPSFHDRTSSCGVSPPYLMALSTRLNTTLVKWVLSPLMTGFSALSWDDVLPPCFLDVDGVVAQDVL